MDISPNDDVALELSTIVDELSAVRCNKRRTNQTRSPVLYNDIIKSKFPEYSSIKKQNSIIVDPNAVDAISGLNMYSKKKTQTIVVDQSEIDAITHLSKKTASPDIMSKRTTKAPSITSKYTLDISELDKLSYYTPYKSVYSGFSPEHHIEETKNKKKHEKEKKASTEVIYEELGSSGEDVLEPFDDSSQFLIYDEEEEIFARPNYKSAVESEDLGLFDITDLDLCFPKELPTDKKDTEEEQYKRMRDSEETLKELLKRDSATCIKVLEDEIPAENDEFVRKKSSDELDEFSVGKHSEPEDRSINEVFDEIGRKEKEAEGPFRFDHEEGSRSITRSVKDKQNAIKEDPELVKQQPEEMEGLVVTDSHGDIRRSSRIPEEDYSGKSSEEIRSAVEPRPYVVEPRPYAIETRPYAIEPRPSAVKLHENLEKDTEDGRVSYVDNIDESGEDHKIGIEDKLVEEHAKDDKKEPQTQKPEDSSSPLKQISSSKSSYKDTKSLSSSENYYEGGEDNMKSRETDELFAWKSSKTKPESRKSERLEVSSMSPRIGSIDSSESAQISDKEKFEDDYKFSWGKDYGVGTKVTTGKVSAQEDGDSTSRPSSSSTEEKDGMDRSEASTESLSKKMSWSSLDSSDKDQIEHKYKINWEKDFESKIDELVAKMKMKEDGKTASKVISEDNTKDIIQDVVASKEHVAKSHQSISSFSSSSGDDSVRKERQGKSTMSNGIEKDSDSTEAQKEKDHDDKSKDQPRVSVTSNEMVSKSEAELKGDIKKSRDKSQYSIKDPSNEEYNKPDHFEKGIDDFISKLKRKERESELIHKEPFEDIGKDKYELEYEAGKDQTVLSKSTSSSSGDERESKDIERGSEIDMSETGKEEIDKMKDNLSLRNESFIDEDGKKIELTHDPTVSNVDMERHTKETKDDVIPVQSTSLIKTEEDDVVPLKEANSRSSPRIEGMVERQHKSQDGSSLDDGKYVLSEEDAIISSRSRDDRGSQNEASDNTKGGSDSKAYSVDLFPIRVSFPRKSSRAQYSPDSTKDLSDSEGQVVNEIDVLPVRIASSLSQNKRKGISQSQENNRKETESLVQSQTDDTFLEGAPRNKDELKDKEFDVQERSQEITNHEADVKKGDEESIDLERLQQGEKDQGMYSESFSDEVQGKVVDLKSVSEASIKDKGVTRVELESGLKEVKSCINTIERHLNLVSEVLEKKKPLTAEVIKVKRISPIMKDMDINESESKYEEPDNFESTLRKDPSRVNEGMETKDELEDRSISVPEEGSGSYVNDNLENISDFDLGSKKFQNIFSPRKTAGELEGVTRVKDKRERMKSLPNKITFTESDPRDISEDDSEPFFSGYSSPIEESSQGGFKKSSSGKSSTQTNLSDIHPCEEASEISFVEDQDKEEQDSEEMKHETSKEKYRWMRVPSEYYIDSDTSIETMDENQGSPTGSNQDIDIGKKDSKKVSEIMNESPKFKSITLHSPSTSSRSPTSGEESNPENRRSSKKSLKGVLSNFFSWSKRHSKKKSKKSTNS